MSSDDTMNEYFRLASFDAAGAFVGDDTQTHDKNGNRIANGEHRLFFDLFDRLVRVERTSDGVTVGNYRYDAAGRRVHKEFLNPASGAQEEVFFVSDGAREIEELDGAGNVIADYVYGSLYIDQVVQMRRGGQDYYLHSNSLFSVSAVTDASGTVVERYDYGSVYGTVTATDDAGGAKSAAAEIRNPWRFTGRRLDPESGLYHYRLRYYDPAQGRFVSRDPLGMWGDPGQRGVEQGYCGGNPVNWVDPFGLDGTDPADKRDWEKRTEEGNLAVQMSAIHALSRNIDDAKQEIEVLGEVGFGGGSPMVRNLYDQIKGWAGERNALEATIFDGTTFTVLVDQPNEGSCDVLGMDSVGHTWLRVANKSTKINFVVGFFPLNDAGPLNRVDQGAVATGSGGHDVDVESKAYPMTLLQLRQFRQLLSKIAKNEFDPDEDPRVMGYLVKRYEVNFNFDLENFNCTDFVYRVGITLGIPLPEPKKVWWDYYSGQSTSPGPYGEKLVGNGGRRR